MRDDIEFAFAIIGVADIVYRHGRSILQKCQACKGPNTQLTEYALMIEAWWLGLEDQLLLMNKLVRAGKISERHRRVQQDVLQVLRTKMELAESKLDELVRLDADTGEAALAPGAISRTWKFATSKDEISEAIAELKKWQQVFDRTWYLMTGIADSKVDSALREASNRPSQDAVPLGDSQSPITTAQHMRDARRPDVGTSKASVLLSRSGIDAESSHQIALSTCRTVLRESGSEMFLLDPISGNPGFSRDVVLEDMKSFVEKFRKSLPRSSGLLQTKGILKDNDHSASNDDSNATPTGFLLVFQLPQRHSEIQSLRWRLLHSPEHELRSLSDRFSLARQLASSVSSVHQYRFVHKNIRPESILIVNGSNGSREMAVLVGFDVLRNADGQTRRLGDDNWEKNLYRHPSRQGKAPRLDYEMRHDIYSLGVCLLEIGLWDSFVSYGYSDGNPLGGLQALQTPASAQLAQGCLNTVEKGAAGMSGPELVKNSRQLKEQLLSLAMGPLQRKMGTKYSRVVRTCLTCLDEDNLDFGDEADFYDEDGVAVGVRYIEKVVQKLAEISI